MLVYRPQPATARQRLVESAGTRFAPHEAVRPVVRVIDGARRHDELAPSDWIAALAAAPGEIAVYFEVAADHEWWLGVEVDHEDTGASWHCWTTYPSGPLEHRALPRGILQQNIEMLYWEGDPEERCDIRRSRVVCIEDAPEFVQQRVSADA